MGDFDIAYGKGLAYSDLMPDGIDTCSQTTLPRPGNDSNIAKYDLPYSRHRSPNCSGPDSAFFMNYDLRETGG